MAARKHLLNLVKIFEILLKFKDAQDSRTLQKAWKQYRMMEKANEDSLT